MAGARDRAPSSQGAPGSSSPPRIGHADNAAPRPRRLLGEILRDEGLITRRQLDDALHAQAEQHPRIPIGQLLVQQGIIRQDQLDAVLDKYRLGDFLVEAKAITEGQLEIALRRQRLTGRRLATSLLELGYVTEPRLRQALATYLGIRFVELEDVALDRGLARLVDRDFARRHRMLPVGRAADQLTVAMDDPGDQSVIASLGRATGFRIEVVTATSAALQRAFTRVYGEPLEGSVRPSSDDPAARALEARHLETARLLAAVRLASEQVRRNLDQQAIGHSPAVTRIPPAPPGPAPRR